MRKCMMTLLMIVSPVWVFGGTMVVENITTAIYPLYADGRNIDDGTPFAVYVEISSWTAAANSQVNVRVTTEGGTHFRIWNGTSWGSAYTYGNCPVRTIDSNGNWSGWVYLRAKNASQAFRAHARDIDNTNIIIHEAISDIHSVTYMDMSTTGAWVHATAAASTAGKAVLAFDGSGSVIGSYAIEDNGVNEGYSPDTGYFKMAVPANTSIAKLEAKNSDNSLFDSQTSTQWQSGTAGSETDLDALQDVSLPVFLISFSAIPQENSILLRWQTASEVNNMGFYIYRGINYAENLQLISGLISGAGNSVQQHTYEYVDQDVRNGVTYYYQLENVDFNGNRTRHQVVCVELESEGQGNSGFSPESFYLSRPHPNPFGPGVRASQTCFSFFVPNKALKSQCTVEVVNLLGQNVITLFQDTVSEGEQVLFWDGTDNLNRSLPAGAYFLTAQGDGYHQTRKILYLK